MARQEEHSQPSLATHSQSTGATWSKRSRAVRSVSEKSVADQQVSQNARIRLE